MCNHNQAPESRWSRFFWRTISACVLVIIVTGTLHFVVAVTQQAIKG